jgi:hypothetical protein
MALLKYKVKGSTLIESIVATIVIMFSFTAVTTIYVNVFRADDHTRKFDGHLILKNTALKVKAEKNYLDKEFKIEELTVEKTVSKYGEAATTDQQLWILKLKLFDVDKKLLCEYKELILY